MHRDLKPQNIILDQKSENAVLKLADFGLAKYAKTKDPGLKIRIVVFVNAVSYYIKEY